MTREHGDNWTCGRCGRVEFAEREDEHREERPPGWRRMSLRFVPREGESSPEGSTVAAVDHLKDFCGPCVKIVSDVWDGAERVEIRKKAIIPPIIPPEAQ